MVKSLYRGFVFFVGMVRDLFLPEGAERFVGEWVVVCERKVVAHGHDLRALRSEIARCKRTPLIAKIPKADVLIF